MTTTQPVSVVRPVRVGRTTWWWAIVPWTVLMPVAYLLGLGAVVWLAPAVALVVLVFGGRPVRVPWRTLPLIVLAAWIPITAVSVHGAGSLAVFAYRWLLWIATLGGIIVLANTSGTRLPTRWVVDRLADLWIVLVGFGYLALAAPGFAVASPFGRLLPGSLASNEFVTDLTIVRFAELQRFIGGSVPRPAAPMIATNGWGSTLAILTPCFILSWLLADDRRRRRAGWWLVAAAVPPFAVSTNRGAALSLAVGLTYVAIRAAVRGNARPIAAITLATGIAVVVVVLTPLGTVVATRLAGAEASNSTRENLYGLAWERTQESPLIGHGEPVANAPDPPIGTHGLVWYAMVAHGLPGFALLVIALVALLVGSFGARTRTGIWVHAAIVIGVIQTPFYGLLPQIVVLGVAAGVCWREEHPELTAHG